MRHWGTALLVLVLLWCSVGAQELSNSIFLTEDELDEALRNGEITYEQYLTLKEIMQSGIDSLSQYLLDEIPNLMYLLDVDTVLTDFSQRDQKTGFGERGRPRHRIGSMSWRYSTQLEEESRSWYRSAVDLSPVERWRLRLNVNREASGVERVCSRSLSYRNRTGFLRRAEIGSFTARFGLGTAFGHRGRLLDFSEQIDGESFLFPDYGGYNGILAEMQTGPYAVHTLGSVVRDQQHSISSSGLFIEDKRGSFLPGVVFGVNRIEQRSTGASASIPVAALLLRSKYSRGSVAAEFGQQGGELSNATSAVIEGRHRFESVELRYAGWHYGDDFVDLTAGSKSGQIYSRDSLEAVEFGFRSRRTGQSGGMVRTQVPLDDHLSCSGSMIFAETDNGERRQQFSGSLVRNFDPAWRVQLTYLGKWERRTDNPPSENSEHQWRLESRYDAAPLSVRCYIGYETDDERRDRGCLFVSARYETEAGGRYQVWSNMGEISHDGLVYWYLFVRGEWPLGQRVIAAAKLSSSYRRESVDRNATQFSAELAVGL
jgi:hypothetical protein